MPKINSLFFDVGGVLLSNAWDHEQRAMALKKFEVDAVDFQERHEMVVSSFERGKISLHEYLERTIFCHPRRFTKEEFCQYMFSLSQPDPAALDLARKLAGSGRYFMATINNESSHKTKNGGRTGQ